MLNNEKKEKLGVVLFNLGGPDKLEDVRPFLYNFFLQPEIIRVRSNLLRKFIAWFISTTRHKKSAGYYSLIGGGSPQRRITEEQATALRAELRRRGIEVNIYVAMRCWQPYTEAVVEAIENDKVTRVIGLPLYPHYSLSTTHSSFKHFIKVLSERGGMRHIKRHYITTWYHHPKYIDAVVETIKDAHSKLPEQSPEATHIIFSAHSIPESYIRDGDPYLKHIEATVELIKQHLSPKHPITLSFQSKVGPVKWLEPLTDSVIEKLSKQGVKQILVVPISFVSEHIETLYELDILYKQVADNVGISHFTRAAALNLNKTFICALADLVEERLKHLNLLEKFKAAPAVQSGD